MWSGIYIMRVVDDDFDIFLWIKYVYNATIIFYITNITVLHFVITIDENFQNLNYVRQNLN